MSQNIYQIFTANPAASMASTDLLYLGRSPYNTTDDFAITFANFVASIGTATPTATTIPLWDANKNLSANNFLSAYATTATAAALTTLTVGSAYYQFFTGTTTQTVKMPVTSTLALGQSWLIVNNSTGAVTVESSGANSIQVMAAGTSLLITCILLTGTTAASWDVVNYGYSDIATANSSVYITNSSGVPSWSTTLPSGLAATNMTLTTPSITGNMTVSATTNINGFVGGNGIGDANGVPVLVVGDTKVSPVNYMAAYNQVSGTPAGIYSKSVVDTDVGLAITAQNAGVVYFYSTSDTPIQIGSGTSHQHATTFSMPDTATSRTITFPDASGTLTLLGNSSTGSGSVVLNTSPTLVGPTLGAALATSINFGGSSLANYIAGASNSWTPVFTFATVGDLSVAYSTQTGTYARIGNIVFWEFVLAFTPTYTTSASYAQITGLILTANSGLQNMPGTSIFSSVTFTGKYVNPLVIANSTMMQFLQTTSAAGFNYLTTTSFLTGVAYTISASGFYFV